MKQPTVNEGFAHDYGKRNEKLELSNIPDSTKFGDAQATEIEQGSHHSATYNFSDKSTEDIRNEMLLVERLRQKRKFPVPKAVLRAIHDPLYRFIAYLEWRFHSVITEISYERDCLHLTVADDNSPSRTFDISDDRGLFLILEIFTNRPNSRQIVFDRGRYEKYLDYVCARNNFEPYNSIGFVEQDGDMPKSVLWSETEEDTVKSINDGDEMFDFECAMNEQGIDEIPF